MTHALKTVALAGLLGAGAVLGVTGSASADVTKTSCTGGECRVMRCDNDGYGCSTISYYHRDGYRPSYYGDTSYYGHDGYYDTDGYWHDRAANRHYTCDAFGENCQWTYY